MPRLNNISVAYQTIALFLLIFHINPAHGRILPSAVIQGSAVRDSTTEGRGCGKRGVKLPLIIDRPPSVIWPRLTSRGRKEQCYTMCSEGELEIIGSDHQWLP